MPREPRSKRRPHEVAPTPEPVAELPQYWGGREIRHIRCPLCGLQSRRTAPPVPREGREPIPRIEDGPYEPLVRVQYIGGSRSKQDDPEGKHRGSSAWTPPEEAMTPDPEEIALLKQQLVAALNLVKGM